MSKKKQDKTTFQKIKEFFRPPKKIAVATAVPRGRGIWIGSSEGTTGTYTGGGGEFGADILNEDRAFAIRREPVAFRVVFTVARDVFDNWFVLKLEGDEEGEKSEVFDSEMQKEMSRLRFKRELTRMATFERAFGYSIIVVGYEDSADNLSEPVTNPLSIREIKAYSPMQIRKVDTVKDQTDPRYGLPEMYYIKRSGIAAYMQVHHSRCIHFATRWIDPTKNEWEGQSVLDDIWDELVTLRNIRWGMGQTMYRYGGGFPDINFKNSNDEDIQDWIDDGGLDNWNSRTGFVHNEDQEFEFKGVAGHQLDPMNYYLPPMEHISAGTGIPLVILRGTEVGAVTGSEVNQMEYYGVVSDEQTAYEPGVIDLITRVYRHNLLKNGSVTSEVPSFKIEWNSGFELSEEKKAQIELVEAQRWQIMGQFMTRNEIRKAIDPELPDLTEEQGGDELLGKSDLSKFEEGEAHHVNPLADGSSVVTNLKRRRRR